MDNRWYLAIDRPEQGIRDYAGFFLYEIDEQRHMTLLEHWYDDPAETANKGQP